MQFETIATERLLLRKITPDVYAYVFTWYNDDEIKNFFGFNTAEELNTWAICNNLQVVRSIMYRNSGSVSTEAIHQYRRVYIRMYL